jgi:hypothetical protein
MTHNCKNSLLGQVSIGKKGLGVKKKDTLCLCSMIMSVVNCSVQMSVWGYGKDTGIEQEGTEAVDGVE